MFLAVCSVAYLPMMLAVRHDILGIPVDDIAHEEVYQRFVEALRHDAKLFVTTPNPEFVLKAMENVAFQQVLRRADLSLSDGVGLMYASMALLGKPLHERVTGIVALQDLLTIAAQEGKRVLVLGLERGDRRDRGLINIRRAFPTLTIEAIDPGFIDPVEPKIPEVYAEQIRAFAPHVVAVALAFGKQEIIADALVRDFPSVNVAIGIGSGIDKWADPSLHGMPGLQKRGLEWLWRLVREPWRYKRMYRAVIVFPFVVAREAARTRGLWRACRDVWQEIRRTLLAGGSAS